MYNIWYRATARVPQSEGVHYGALWLPCPVRPLRRRPDHAPAVLQGLQERLYGPRAGRRRHVPRRHLRHAGPRDLHVGIGAGARRWIISHQVPSRFSSRRVAGPHHRGEGPRQDEDQQTRRQEGRGTAC